MDWFDGFQEFVNVVYGPLIYFGLVALFISSLVIAIILALLGLVRN